MRSVRANLSLPGDVEPEAFSVDGKRLFILSHDGDSYRVQSIELATGERVDVGDRDKTIQPETMYGQPAQAVFDHRRELLATLYREPNDYFHPAFVHVLNLATGWSYCVDLEAPFGTGTLGEEVIRVTPKNTILVGGKGVNRTAEIEFEAVLDPIRTVGMKFHERTLTREDDGFRTWEGFRSVIAQVTDHADG